MEAKLLSSDTKAAEAMKGVVVVRDGDFIGVAAPDHQTAVRAEKAIAVHWQAPGQPGNEVLFDYLKKNAAASRGSRRSDRWRMVWPAADKKLSQTYTIAYIAHAPLEPRAAVAEWNDGKLTVWTGTQRPLRRQI
jgi:isoquinoline 1-oxidoreductase